MGMRANRPKSTMAHFDSLLVDARPELSSSQAGMMVENSTVAPSLQRDLSSASSSAENTNNDMVYLNNAAQARLSPNTKAAGCTAIGNNGFTHADDSQRRVRELFASLIDATSDCIAIHPSTAFAITLAAENVYRMMKDGGKIVVLQDEMCSAVYPWQAICEREKNFTLDIVEYPTRTSWTDAVLARLDKSVAVACLPPLHWSDGALLDLVVIGKRCRELGILLIVDSTQATGILKCSVKEIQCAMLACSVHKWLRGPSGTSLVYIHPEWHKIWSPLDQHGRGRDLGGPTWDAAKDEMGPHGYPEKFYDDARKFDSGGKPNPILLPMLEASLEEVVQIDIDKAQSQLKGLMSPLLDWAIKNDYSLTKGPHAYHLVGIRPNNKKPDEMIEIANRLATDRIYIAVRCGAFRISPYLDTREKEIERLMEALCKFVQ